MRSLHTLMVVATLLGLETPRLIADPGPSVSRESDPARLRELLYSRGQPQEQSQAALLLVQSDAPECVELVREGLRRWDRADVFQAVAAAIRLRRDGRHVDALLKALTSEQQPLRQSAVDALARLDSPNLVNRLLGLAEDSEASLTARQAAATALGRSGQKPAALALMSLLTTESPPLRQSAASGLEELTGQAHGANLGPWQAWWQQHKDLTETEWHVNQTAYLSDRARRLEDDLRRAEDHVLRLHQQLFSKIPPTDRPSYFRALSQSEYPTVRTQAMAWVIETLPQASSAEQKQLVDLLLLLTDDGVEAVQRQAVLALEKVDDPRVFERLLGLLETGTVNVRAAAARSLGRYRCTKAAATDNLSARAIAALEKALADQSLNVVAEAVESLGSLGVPEAAPIVAGLLRHPNDGVRQAAARALEQVANAKVLGDVRSALEDPVPSVRFSLIGALGKIGSADGVEPGQKKDILKRLEQVLVRDGDPGVRSRAATVIGDLGTANELPILWQRVTATEDNRVQLKAWTAMIDILSRSASWPLVSQWEQTLATQRDTNRRIEMLTEIRHRWIKVETAKPSHDLVTGALVQAQLASRKWSLASPLALDLARRAPNDAEMQKRLRWLLVVGNQALEDRRPQDALQLLKDVEDLLPRAGADLAAEFDYLRQRASRLDRP